MLQHPPKTSQQNSTLGAGTGTHKISPQKGAFIKGLDVQLDTPNYNDQSRNAHMICVDAYFKL
jgi:hypothetical protein